LLVIRVVDEGKKHTVFVEWPNRLFLFKIY
jgi:hypothetical protein